MKIINIVQDFQTGGIQKLLLEYLRYFKNNKEIDYQVVVLEKAKGSLYDEICKKEGLKIRYLNGHTTKNKHYYFRQFVLWKSYDYALYKLLRKEKPDIVHTHNTRIFKRIFWSIKKLHKKYKWVHTLHSDPYAVHDIHIPFAQKAFGDFNLTPICLNQSQFIKAKSRYGIKTCYFLNNCFDIETLKKNVIDANEFKKSLSIKNDSFIVGSVGRIDPVKNYLFLAEIIYNIKKIKNNVLCIIVGDNSSSSDLQDQIKKYSLQDNFLLVGNRNDVGNFYNIFDRFVTTSLSEASSFVCLEAQSFNKYCIISEAVPPETICTKNKVIRLNVNCNIDIWVKEILTPKSFAEPLSEISDYNIEKTSNKLLQIYKTKISVAKKTIIN